MVHSYLENKTLYGILRHHWSLMSNCHDLTCWILMNAIVLVLGTARGGHGTGRFLFKSPREPGPDYKVPFGFSFGLDSNSFLVYLVSFIFYQSQWLRFFFSYFCISFKLDKQNICFWLRMGPNCTVLSVSRLVLIILDSSVLGWTVAGCRYYTNPQTTLLIWGASFEEQVRLFMMQL